METGKNGFFDLSETSAGITIRVYWQEAYDIDTNKSVITITDIQAKSSKWLGISYYLGGSISVNGIDIITFDSSSRMHYVYWGSLNTFASVRVQNGGVLPPWESVAITHNADGNKTISIDVDISGYTTTTGVGSGWNIAGSESVELTHIDWGVVRIGGDLYRVYSDTGSSLEQVLPFRDTGSTLELYSG